MKKSRAFFFLCLFYWEGSDIYLLIVNSQFKSCRTPINKLNSPPHFNRRNSLIRIPRNHIPTIQQSTSHIMSSSRITNNHLIMRFKTLKSNILNTMRFMLCFGFRYDWCARDERIVNSWVRDEIGLEFCEVDVQGSFESEGGGD